MKKLITAAAVLALSIAGTAAYGAELQFQIDPSTSSVNSSITSCQGIGACSVTTTLDAGLGSQSFSLAQGQSDTFNFFNVSVDGILNRGTVDVTADLGFLLPANDVVSSTGTGEYVTFLGVVSGGTLTWTQPNPVFLSNGSEFSVDLSNISAFGFGNSAEVTATVTADTVATPEPAAISLLGIGLAGIGALAFRKRRSTRALPLA